MADVMVIGAGPAGLIAAYYLRAAGIDFRMVEKADHVGSTWSNLYPSLKLNTINFLSKLPGEPTVWEEGWFMSGQRFHQQMVDFQAKHQFDIEFNVEVTHVAPEGDGWRVVTNRDSGWYAAVMIASGKFNNPFIPDFPGQDDFTGTRIHARDFHDPRDFAGQRVMVVGSGPSGADISSALTETAQHPIYVSVRSDMLLARSFPYGLPAPYWRWILRGLPDRVKGPLYQHIGWRTYRDLDRYGIKIGRNREEREGTSAPVRGPEFYNGVRDGHIKVVPGLARLGADYAETRDGARYPIDALILATGYRPALGYLDITYETDRDGWPVRDDGQEVAGYPGLYIVGRFYQGQGPVMNFIEEAQITARQLQARLAARAGARAATPDEI